VPNFKRQYVRSKKLLNASNGRPCARCGRQDGTIVRCHYTGFRQHSFGKGRGIKADDHCSADLCKSCHAYFDNPKQHKSIEASEEFMYLILMALRQDFIEGIIE